jgi:hypothetical protein
MTQTPSRALTALFLAAGLGLATVAPAHAAAKAAAEAASAPSNVVRRETLQLFKDAQDRQVAKDWVGQLAKLKEAEVVGNLTPYEAFLVAQGRAVAYTSLKDNENAVANFRLAIDAGFLPPEAKIAFIAYMYQLQAFDLKRYKDAIATVAEYRAAGGTNPDILDAVPMLLHNAGDDAAATASQLKQIDAEVAATGKPGERSLRFLVGLQQSAGDDAGLAVTAEKLALFYPKRDVWYDVVQRAPQAPGVDKMRLDSLRLRYTILGYAPREGSALVTHAELASRAGYPAEAKQLLDMGLSKGLVAAGDVAEVTKLRDQIAKSAATERASDKATEAAARSAKDGESLMGYGLEVFLDGQADRGIALMEAGMQKGGLRKPEDAKLHLGMAYLRAGRLDDAKKTLQSIGTKEGPGALARIYLMWIQIGAKIPEAAAPAAKAASGS